MPDLTRKSFGLDIKEMEDEDNVFTFKGYASTFGNEDYYGDTIMPGAFDSSLKAVSEGRTIVKVLWQHDGWEPIGIASSLKIDKKGLLVEGHLPLDDDFVKNRVVPQLKIGSINEMSIGFYIKDFKEFKEGDDWKREIYDLDLKEFSLVTFPANPEAKITELKSIDSVKNMGEEELRNILTKGAPFGSDAVDEIVKAILTQREAKVLKQQETTELMNKCTSMLDSIKKSI